MSSPSSPKPNKNKADNMDMGELFRQRRAKASSKVNAAFEQSPTRNHRRNNGRAQQILSYPLEQGCIRNLKDNFGFIQCVAQREEELFFHYSEVIEGAARLSPDQEVEFRVGPDPRSGRVAAFQIKTLPAGTIEWETVEYNGVRQTGLVERRPAKQRGRSSDGSAGEGTIRLLLQQKDDTTTNDDDATTEAPVVVTKDGPLVRFTAQAYDAAPNTSNDARQSNELGRGDLVECLVIKEKRTGFCYARDITRLLTERERTRQEKERKLMAAATLEKGVVVALKDGFGFLRSSSRREEIFFHYDNIDLNENDPDNAKEEENFVLKEGQEMEFLVVDEAVAKTEQQPKPQMPKPRTVQRRISARRVKLQPRGSVKFNEVVARGITGVLAEPPQCIDSSHALETHGKILLHHPVEVKQFSMGDPVAGTRTVTEVFLSPQDAPGGRFSFHNGSSVGLYVEPGDTLLFDLAIDYCDGACRAVPTAYLTPKEGADDPKQSETDSAVRLINLSLAGRAEGFVGAVKDTYGFIQYVERPVDVHFKMFQLLPDNLQETLRLNLGIPNHDEDGKPLRLEVGANVQFDLSLRGTIGVTKPRGKRAAQERENLKAQRVLLLPQDSVNRFVCVASAVKGTVAKQELMQPFVGNVELEVPIPQLQPNLRHPFVWNLLSGMVAEQSSRPVMYHDTQSHHEETTVRRLAELVGGLEVSIEEKPPARFMKISLKSEEDEVPEEKTEEPSSAEADAKSDDGEEVTKAKPDPKAPKILKTVRFDKKSFSDELLNDFPLSKGDVIACDIVQCRRTGQSHAENVAVVERNTADPEPLGVTTTGLVKDIGFSKMFAFIAVADDACEYNQQTVYCRATQDNGVVSKLEWRKGDNVQFELCKEAGGRVVACNVTKLARGSVAAKSSGKAECRGIVLLQPTQTSLKNTPNRRGKLGSNNAPLNETNSRWGNVNLNDEASKDDEPLLELGVILITDDPDGLFANEVESGAEPAKDSLRAKKLAESTGDGKLFVRFKSSAIGGNPYSQGGGKTLPRRGDMVSFSRGVSGKGPMDVKVVQREVAKPTRGVLTRGGSDGKATLEVEDTGDKMEVGLEDVVSCEVATLKDNEKVEWLSYDGGVYGIARMSDLYLESKQGVGHKERPRLNLAVKKDRGGKIMAQTKQAKGPDGGGNGFASGWTERTSQFHTTTIETDLSPDADDFVPPNLVVE